MRALFALMFACSAIALGDGTLTVKQPIYSLSSSGNAQYTPEFDLSITQPLSANWEFQSWTGFIPNYWLNTYNGVLYRLTPGIRIGADINYTYSLGGIPDQMIQPRAVIEFKLW